MAFNAAEKAALLEVKGVGPTVIKRFEDIGINSFSELASYEPKEIAERVASMLKIIEDSGRRRESESPGA